MVRPYYASSPRKLLYIGAKPPTHWFRNSDTRIREQRGNNKSSLLFLDALFCSFMRPQTLAAARIQRSAELCIGLLARASGATLEARFVLHAAFCRRDQSLSY